MTVSVTRTLWWNFRSAHPDRCESSQLARVIRRATRSSILVLFVVAGRWLHLLEHQMSRRVQAGIQPLTLAPVLPNAAPQRLYSDRAEIGDAQLGNQEVLAPGP
jgi:hypothetical protein